MKKLFLGALLATGLATPALASEGVEGFWLTQNERAVIEIAACEDDQGAKSVCGYIHWIIEGGLQNDIHNEDESLRGRPMCDLQILGGFKQDGDHAWEDGFIYKADDGDIYDANIALQEEGRLKLRGYVGISLLGKTQHWTRVSAKDYKSCKS